jgi:hypothetical protein
MIVNFWVGNTDWPHQNWYAWGKSRANPTVPWRFASWDAEHTVKQWDFNFLANANLGTANSQGEILRLLTNNAEFRVLFGDHVHRLMFNGGPLYTTPDRAAFWTPTNPAVNLPGAAYRKRVNEIWNSVVCESARWGDVATARVNQPYTRELEYIRELNALFSITNLSGQTVNFFPLRGSNALAQFRAGGLYPTVAAPAFSQHGVLHHQWHRSAPVRFGRGFGASRRLGRHSVDPRSIPDREGARARRHQLERAERSDLFRGCARPALAHHRTHVQCARRRCPRIPRTAECGRNRLGTGRLCF